MTTQDELRDVVCGCGDGPEAAIQVLKDFLDVFEPHNRLAGYLSLDKCRAFTTKYGVGVYHLIFCLMQKAGYTGHFGSVVSSGFLEPSGGDLKEAVNDPEFVMETYANE